MKTIVIISWITTIFFFIIGAWPVGLLNLLIAICLTAIMYKKGSKQNQQNEIEQREKELLRKQNEILVHLIQDEHREEGR